METDRDIARRVQDMQERGQDIPLVHLPGYMEWSEQKLAEGVSEALIAHLDSLGMFLLPEQAQAIGVEVYEELLAELEKDIGNYLE